jgi:hypothetical protein
MTDSSIVLELGHDAKMEDAVCIQHTLFISGVLPSGEWHSGISIERSGEFATIVQDFNIGTREPVKDSKGHLEGTEFTKDGVLRFKLSGNQLEIHGPQKVIDVIGTFRTDAKFRNLVRHLDSPPPRLVIVKPTPSFSYQPPFYLSPYVTRGMRRY